MADFIEQIKKNWEQKEDIERLRQTEKPTIPFSVFLSVIALLYVHLHPEIFEFRTHVAVLLLVLNLSVFSFQMLIVPSKYYNQLYANLEPLFLSIFAVLIIVWTGGFNSPFYFTLYLIVLSTPINKIIPPVFIGLAQILMLVAASVLAPHMQSVLLQDPLRAFLLILSPAGVTFFTATMLYETLTQRKEKEKAEKMSELLTVEKAKLETILSSVSDIIIAVDKNENIIIANKPTEHLGHKLDFIANRKFRDAFPSVDIEKETFQIVEFGRKESSPVHCKVWINPLIDKDKNVLGKVIVMHDISQEKDLERMKLDFVSMATHELRTPLTSIKGYLSFLTPAVSHKLNEEEKDFIDKIKISTEMLSVLIENILSISNIERKALHLDFSTFEINSHIKNVINQLQTFAKTRKQTVRTSFQGKYEVYADELRINEVISNLIDNAIKFTPENGNIEISVKKVSGKIVVCVADNGPGIPKDAQKHLFTKFYRVAGKLQAGSKGTGLGLYICKKILDLHNEKIWLDNTQENGCKFCFSLKQKQAI